MTTRSAVIASQEAGLQDQHVYFYAKFSKPFKSYGIAVNNVVQEGVKKADGKNIKLVYSASIIPGEVVSKVGISAVSAGGALKKPGCRNARF
jgi:putative alpha-1,2-mannosidase